MCGKSDTTNGLLLNCRADRVIFRQIRQDKGIVRRGSIVSTAYGDSSRLGIGGIPVTWPPHCAEQTWRQLG